MKDSIRNNPTTNKTMKILFLNESNKQAYNPASFRRLTVQQIVQVIRHKSFYQPKT
jgi:hypothetical protein